MHAPILTKKGDRIIYDLHARQPVNADGSAGGVTPELNELLNGEDTSEVLDASAILGMAAFELVVGQWVPGDPANVGYTDNVAVQVSFQNAGTASGAASIDSVTSDRRSGRHITIAPGLDLGGLLQVLSVSVHLGQNSADPIILDAEFLDPLLVIGAGLVRDGHVLELGFLGEVDVIHRTSLAGWPCASCTTDIGQAASHQLPLSLKLGSLGDDVTGA